MDVLVAMRSFVAVVQEGSMNAAARRLNVSGALVGQRIAALEDRLDTRLLNRSTRYQSLTEFGEVYYRQSMDILELVALSDDQAAAGQTRPQGLLRVTAPASFGSEALVPALPKFREVAPDVRLDIVLTDHNLDVIADGVDVAFRIGRLENSDLIRRKLRPYRMMACASHDYIAIHGMPQHPDELNGHKSVGFTRTTSKPWRFERDGETRTWSPDTVISLNSGQAVRMAARAGLGIVMQPEILLSQDVASGDLVEILHGWTLPEKSLSLLYHRDQHMPLRLSTFVDFAIQEF